MILFGFFGLCLNDTFAEQEFSITGSNFFFIGTMTHNDGRHDRLTHSQKSLGNSILPGQSASSIHCWHPACCSYCSSSRFSRQCDHSGCRMGNTSVICWLMRWSCSSKAKWTSGTSFSKSENHERTQCTEKCL